MAKNRDVNKQTRRRLSKKTYLSFITHVGIETHVEVKTKHTFAEAERGVLFFVPALQILDLHFT